MFKEFHHHTRGRGHELAGVVGQDRTAYRSRGGIQVLCLADGAGSASRAELGAQTLAEQGCKLLAESFTDLIATKDGAQAKKEILQSLLSRLERVAEKHKCSVEDLASTFLAVATNGARFITIHVGDGVVGYLKEGELRVISAPDNAEFANQTTFVTSADALATVRLARGSLDGAGGFILMSDGASSSLYNYRTHELAPACEKLIQAVAAQPPRLTKSSESRKRLKRFVETKLRAATKDDCSIGVLARS